MCFIYFKLTASVAAASDSVLLSDIVMELTLVPLCSSYLDTPTYRLENTRFGQNGVYVKLLKHF